MGRDCQKVTADETTARSERLSRLKAEADQWTVMGQHSKAAAAHYARGEMHEAAGNPGTAIDCYKKSLDAMAKHAACFGAASDCYWSKRGGGK